MPFLGVWHFRVNLHVSDINRFQETLKLPWWLSTAESTCNAGDNEVPGWIPQRRRAWQPTPVFLPGDSHGQKSLMGYSPQGCKASDTTEATEHALETLSRINSDSLEQ